MEPVRGVWVPEAEWIDISYSRREWWVVSADASGLLKRRTRTSLGGPVAKTPHSQCRGSRFNP